MTEKKIRVGVVGVGRGMSFARGAEVAGMELVALCDTWEAKLGEAGKTLGVATYVEYGDFLAHEMDAVVLANYFHEHAPFAIQALEAGLHVMSETAACHTLAEGAALARAVERSGRVYMFAENYPFFAYNQEMRRLYRAGAIGKFLYGECEYVHPDPAEVKLKRSVGWDHWRNWIPSTYYCTHSIAPVMYITDTRPVRVSAFVVAHDFDDPTLTHSCKRGDTAAALMLRMDSGAVLKSLHGQLRGHGNFTRIHGNAGLMENCRAGDRRLLWVRREPFDKDPREPVEKVYLPDFPEHHDLAARAGHGGGDFWTNHHFAQAIRTGRPPYLDVYRGIDMSITGIQAWRSALAESASVGIPDFRDEAQRKAHEDDHWSPDPARAADGQPASSILGKIDPPEEGKALARELWAKQGWKEEEDE